MTQGEVGHPSGGVLVAALNQAQGAQRPAAPVGQQRGVLGDHEAETLGGGVHRQVGGEQHRGLGIGDLDEI